LDINDYQLLVCIIMPRLNGFCDTLRMPLPRDCTGYVGGASCRDSKRWHWPDKEQQFLAPRRNRLIVFRVGSTDRRVRL